MHFKNQNYREKEIKLGMRGKTVKDQKRGKENRGLLTSLV